MMQVEHRKRFAGEDHLVVVQPDGTLVLIPAWMSEDIARLQRSQQALGWLSKRWSSCRRETMCLSPLEAGPWPLREGGDHATKTPLAMEPV